MKVSFISYVSDPIVIERCYQFNLSYYECIIPPLHNF